ncbi:MAG: hypothetical protein L0I84_03775 [Halomonas subglaciescola]|nr:hypothetical protein [Halomonas subglaciescola]
MPATSLTLTDSPVTLNWVTPSGLEPISPLWLRERTRDPQQLDALTCQRLFDSHRIDPDLTLSSARPVSPTHTEFTFSDGHVEVYDLGALAVELDGDSTFPDAIAWDSSVDQTAQRFDWQQMGDNVAFHQALSAYLQRGYIILTGVPTDPERILEVGRHFGYVKETNFGRYFEVYSRPAGNDLAYRSVALGWSHVTQDMLASGQLVALGPHVTRKSHGYRLSVRNPGSAMITPVVDWLAREFAG